MKKILTFLTLSLFLLVSCADRPPVDIINPDAEYLYFFGSTCPHCQELNKIAGERDLYSQISIEKREVYNNVENRALFQKLIDEIQPDSDGVPFVYDTITGKVAVGVRPALELMTSRLWNKNTSQEVTEESIDEKKEIEVSIEAQ